LFSEFNIFPDPYIATIKQLIIRRLARD